MTPRPLIKWKSFWLGILVLVFLGWAWLRSMSQGDWVSWQSKGRELYVVCAQGKGLVGLGWREGISWVEPGIDHGSVKVADKEGSGFPRAIKFGVEHDMNEVCFADWFLILLFLLPWVGFLAWRVRRQLKHTA